MKTAISVPDDVFTRVEQVAGAHGLNRSQFYSVAAQKYADELTSADLTSAIDAALDTVEQDESTAFAVTAGRRTLGADAEEW